MDMENFLARTIFPHSGKTWNKKHRKEKTHKRKNQIGKSTRDITMINRRKKTKDLAKQAWLSRSTVIKYYGISREEYEREAAEKRKLAFNLRSSGFKLKEVAEKMDTTQNSAIAYYRRYLALRQ